MTKQTCYFCLQNQEEIDYKNTELLARFISLSAKIRSRKKTGCCTKHQRRLARAIKRTRHLGLLPVTIR
ncbi:MAG: 30S ribosomal protein S18 [bacterium]|nr:30S ribosomal protein S18 [bacterium]